MNIKLVELFKVAFSYQQKNYEFRYGQSLMNALHDIDAEAYKEIDDAYDPFYNDNRVNKFLEYLEKRWS